MKLQLKKSALLVGAAVLLAGAVTLSVRHYQDYQAEQNAKRQVVVDQQAKAIADLKADVQVLAKAANDNRVNCEKGIAAYNLLSPVLKTKTPLPECGAVIVR